MPAPMLSGVGQDRAGVGVRGSVAHAVLLEVAIEAAQPGAVQFAARSKATQLTRNGAAGISCQIDALIEVHEVIRARE